MVYQSYQSVESVIDEWRPPGPGLVLPLDDAADGAEEAGQGDGDGADRGGAGGGGGGAGFAEDGRGGGICAAPNKRGGGNIQHSTLLRQKRYGGRASNIQHPMKEAKTSKQRSRGKKRAASGGGAPPGTFCDGASQPRVSQARALRVAEEAMGKAAYDAFGKAAGFVVSGWTPWEALPTGARVIWMKVARAAIVENQRQVEGVEF